MPDKRFSERNHHRISKPVLPKPCGRVMRSPLSRKYAVISDYLSTYDITALCESITWKLAKSLGEGSNQSRAS